MYEEELKKFLRENRFDSYEIEPTSLGDHHSWHSWHSDRREVKGARYFELEGSTTGMRDALLPEIRECVLCKVYDEKMSAALAKAFVGIENDPRLKDVIWEAQELEIAEKPTSPIDLLELGIGYKQELAEFLTSQFEYDVDEAVAEMSVYEAEEEGWI